MLQNEDGDWVEDVSELKSMVNNFYKDLLGKMFWMFPGSDRIILSPALSKIC